MATKKSTWGLFFGILVLVMSALVLGSAVPVGAETLNYKFYSWMIKSERVPVGDVEGHAMSLVVRGSFMVFENGEVATSDAVITSDTIKGSGSFINYGTAKFSDGSTIITKSQGTIGGGATGSHTGVGWTSEIIKGTGRFEGIKGTLTSQTKYLPVEKGELGPKGYGEGTITYSLPPK